MNLSEASFANLVGNFSAIVIVTVLAITLYKIVKAIAGRNK